MNDTNDYVDERAGRFFGALARAKSIKIEVKTPVRQDVPVGFVRSLRVALPTLMLTVCANAQSNTPDLIMQVNDQEVEKMLPIEQRLEQFLSFSHTIAETLPELVKCARTYYQQNDQNSPGAAAMLFHVQQNAIEQYSRIIEWSITYGRDVKLGVAAYCQNPKDWEGVIMQWDNNAQRYQNESVPEHAANYVLSRRAARSDTIYAAVQYAAFHQQQNEGQGLTQRVNGFDWVGAGAALAAGAAALMGNKPLNEGLKNTARQTNRAENLYNQAQRAKQRTGPDRYEQIGRVMEQAARLQQLNQNKRPSY